MLSIFVAKLVDFCRHHAVAVVLLALGMTLLLGNYAVRHLGMNTETASLISSDLPFRQTEIAFDRLFPQSVDLLVIVIDGASPELADHAAQTLAQRLAERRDLFTTVRQPGGGDFFKRNGALFLSIAEVQDLADHLIQAQPLIGSLAADPSLRGLFEALGLAVEGVRRGESRPEDIAAPLAALATAVESGRTLSWQSLLAGRDPQPEQLRRFVLAQPVLDYTALDPGGRAIAATRQIARELGLTPDRGLRVRLTGPVALGDEELASVAEGAGLSFSLSSLLVCLLLVAALHLPRLILAILVTLACGLVATAAFAAAAVGTLNPISVAFAVMFVGIAVDFGIQVCVRYRQMRYMHGDLPEALHRTARSIAGSLVLAAGTTAVGFLSFLPTAYVGVAQLGLIAGVSMLIAVVLNLTLLPALIALLRPPPEPLPVGFAWAARLDDMVIAHRRPVMIASLALAALGIVLLPQLSFDFDPLNLRDRNTESVSTALDLAANPQTSPYTIDVLAPSPQAASHLADRLGRLAEVGQAVTLTSFVPEDQGPKLQILADAAMLLDPTLTPPTVRPPPSEDEARAAKAAVIDRLRGLPEGQRLAAALAGRDVAELTRILVMGLPGQLDALRAILTAQPVTMDSLPPDLVRDWMGPDGQTRIEISPRDISDGTAALARFVEAVRRIAPRAGGPAVSIFESGRVISSAFLQAGLAALAAIVLLLVLVLRRLADMLLVIAPLLLAGLLTATACVILGLSLNFANIIALPLMLGIGVAFNIYFVMNWRAGLIHPLQSGTARAVLFSALTTAASFGSLAVSTHPGTASMGLLLSLSLGFTLACTLLVLPALLAGVSPGGTVPVFRPPARRPMPERKPADRGPDD